MVRHRLIRILALVALACAGAGTAAHASGPWSTFIRMQTCGDLVALRDTVWMASGEAGLVRYLRTSGRWEFVTREPGGLASNRLRTLAFDRSGRLWAGTGGRGASRFTPASGRWDLVNTFDGLPSDTVTVTRVDGDTIWIGTTRGIALWDGRQVAGSVPDIGTPSPFRSNDITGIVVRGDSLLVATDDGLYLARLSQNLSAWSGADAGIVNKSITALVTDRADVIALAGGVTYRLDPNLGTWAGTGTTGQGTTYSLRDDFGTMLCLATGGTYRWSASTWNWIPNAPYPVNPDDGGVEYGVDPDGKLLAFDGTSLIEEATGGFVPHTPPGPVGNNVQNLLSDGRTLWVLTFFDGVSRFDGSAWRNWVHGCCGPNQDTTFVDPSYAFTLQFDRQGRVWTSHWESAIERLDPSRNPPGFEHIFKTAGLQVADTLTRHSDGWSSAVDSSGFVYIGGDTPDRGVLEPMGIDVYDASGTRVINWKSTNAGLGGNQVRAITIDQKYGNIWAGFAGAGVAWAAIDSIDGDRLAPGNDHRRLPRFTRITELNSADVFGVVAHGDSIWVLTDRDVKRISARTQTVQSSLEIPPGIAPRGAVHPLEVSRDGTVWVGTLTGVRRFPPGGGFTDYTIANSPLADNEVRAITNEPGSRAVWIGTASGINRFDPGYTPPPAPKIPRLALLLWPNPMSLNALGARLKLSGNTTSYAGEILDLGGRVLHRFSGSINGSVVWDGRDDDGRLVQAGIYFVHARGGGHEALQRVVVLR